MEVYPQLPWQREIGKRDWREVKKELDAETEKIWSKPPIDVLRLANGILPYKPGHHGQYHSVYITMFSIFFMLQLYIPRVVYLAINDATFTLEQCKKIVADQVFRIHYYILYNYSERVFDLTVELRKAIPTVKSKEEMRELMASYFTYVGRHWWWITHYLPYAIRRQSLKPITKEDIEELTKLAEGAYKV